MLIAQLSDVHVGGARYSQELLHAAIYEINAAEPDIVVVAGDLTDDGYPDQYPLAKQELEAIACEHVILVPGNHDARNVGYLRSSRTRSARATGACGSTARARHRAGRGRLVEARPRRGRDRARALRLDRGGLRRRRGPPDLRLPPPPDARARHRPRAKPGAGRRGRDLAPAPARAWTSCCRATGTCPTCGRWPGCTSSTRAPVSTYSDPRLPAPGLQPDHASSNGRIAVELKIPGGELQSLGDYPRDWPEELLGAPHRPVRAGAERVSRWPTTETRENRNPA